MRRARRKDRSDESHRAADGPADSAIGSPRVRRTLSACLRFLRRFSSVQLDEIENFDVVSRTRGTGNLAIEIAVIQGAVRLGHEEFAKGGHGGLGGCADARDVAES